MEGLGWQDETDIIEGLNRTLADRDYSDISGNALVNVQLLENTLKEEGFRCYWKEWWHYTDEISYPVE